MLKLINLSACILLLTIAACTSSPAPDANSSGGVAPAPAGSSGERAAAAIISASDKPLDVMTKAMRAQLDAKSYRAHITSTSSEGTNKMVIEYVAPDRYRMVSEGQAGGSGKSFNQEFIIVGGTTYIKGPNGQWVKSPVNMGEMVKAFRDPKVVEELTRTADVKFIGPDTLDGKPMLVYEYAQNNVMGMNIKSIARTWVAALDGLPRKSEAEGEFRGIKTKTLMTVSDYNSNIKIEAPIK